MKKRIIVALCMCLILAAVTVPAFAATDSENAQQVIVALGIMTGDSSGNLKLTANATRAEFAKMLVTASSYKDTIQNGSGSSPFKDVKYSHWASDYIKTTVDSKWMTGYVDGTFRPNSVITYEQAASAVLKLLGYGTEDLTGTYPKAQLSKFVALNLADGISPKQGSALTRNECMFIFYNLMGAKTRNGEVYGTTLGYTVDSNGDIDYDALVKKDVTGPIIMGSNALSSIIPFNLNSATVFRDGLRSAPDAVKEYDVVYYNTSTKLVLTYSNHAIGIYSAATPNTTSPTSVIVDGTNYPLGTTSVKNKLSSSGEFKIGDEVALLLGKDGDAIDAVDAHKVSKDYYSAPYVMTGGHLSSLIPTEFDTLLAYRNNKPASPDTIGLYDVVYFNEYTNTLWAYSNRAIGTCTDISPNSLSPTSVTVSGNTFTLGTSTAKDRVSAAGGTFSVGDTVALLLGMNGAVVDIIDASEVDGNFYGIVTKSEMVTYSVNASNSVSENTLTVMCTDGILRRCAVTSDDYNVGNIVTISYAKGNCNVLKLTSNSLSGTFSTDGKTFSGYKLSAGIEIMDISTDGEWVFIYPSRLSGVKLEAGNVRYFALNERKEISHLILNDVTGDMYAYGVLINVQEITTPAQGSGLGSINGIYQYIIDGIPGVLNTSDKLYNIGRGPTIFYYKSGKIDQMSSMKSAAINQLSELSVISGTQKFAISNSVQVYIRAGAQSSTYKLSTLSAVNTDEYSLTGYYETIYPAGGQIRIIIAVKK